MLSSALIAKVISMLIGLITMFMVYALYLEIKLSRSFRMIAKLINSQTPPIYHIALNKKLESNFSIIAQRLAVLEDRIHVMNSKIQIGIDSVATKDEMIVFKQVLEKNLIENLKDVFDTNMEEVSALKASIREDRYKNMRKAFGGKEDKE
jgi:hypothetical protein